MKNIFIFAILVVGCIYAQDAIVIAVCHSDSVELSKKYAAYDKAKTEWEASRAKAVKRYATDQTQCGLKFSATFEYAVPDTCPVYQPTWVGGVIWGPANQGATGNPYFTTLSNTISRDDSWR
jgi:hypothetical protein